MRKLRYLLAILGLLLLLGILGGLKGAQIAQLIGFGEAMQKAGPPPEVVSTRPAEQQTWEKTISSVASVVSAKGVALSNDAPGVVSKLRFDSGMNVKQGDVLVELDTSVERAQLASLRARRQLSETSMKRSQALVTSGAIAQAQVDTDESTFKSLTADVAALEAQIARKVIRAPFSGRVGMRQVNLGQYLAPGTPVAVLESSDSDFIDFTLPQQQLDVLKVGMKIRAVQEGRDAPPVEGTLTAIDPSVDPTTRTIKARATIPGAQSAFRPGMFLKVAVVLPETSNVVVVPATAIVHASYGDSLFVVETKPGPGGAPSKVARQQFVKLGEARGDFVAVLDGAEAGEEVVTSGAFKLRNGAPLKINNDVKLDAQLDPRPPNR